MVPPSSPKYSFLSLNIGVDKKTTKLPATEINALLTMVFLAATGSILFSFFPLMLMLSGDAATITPASFVTIAELKFSSCASKRAAVSCLNSPLFFFDISAAAKESLDRFAVVNVSILAAIRSA